MQLSCSTSGKVRVQLPRRKMEQQRRCNKAMKGFVNCDTESDLSEEVESELESDEISDDIDDF